METSPELFIVAQLDEKLIGFCMGYYCENKEIKKLWMKKNLFRLFLAACQLFIRGDKKFFAKILPFKNKETVEFIDNSYDYLDVKEKFDLLSICVIEELRGTGIACCLIDAYEEIGKLHERKACVLSAKRDNIRAVKFYEKQKYQAIRKTKTGISFIKRLV